MAYWDETGYSEEPMDDYGRPLEDSYQQALRQQAENEQRASDQAAADAIESMSPMYSDDGDFAGRGADGTSYSPSFGDSGGLNALKKLFQNKKGGTDYAKLAMLAMAARTMARGPQPNVTKVGFQGTIPTAVAKRERLALPVDNRPAGSSGRRYFTPMKYERMAEGGLTALASGRYLQGQTDGMADKIPAQIGEDQPAALSHGEFVIPADVVSHLGNGNSDAGAKKLYQMMDKIRQARTGTKKQGKRINPDKFMPGGLAQAYAAGGNVKHFEAGGDVTPISTESTLSSWASPYVTKMLSDADALGDKDYEEYTGKLTAPESSLQTQGFAGIKNLADTGYGNTTFTGGKFDNAAAQQYMNPYIQSALNPQLAELRRQNEISNMGINAKMTGAGAFGGGRQAIMNAEGNRNMMQEMNKTVGQGYATAYDKAMAQFNADQGRDLDAQKASEQSKQFGAEYGLRTNADLLAAGATQRAIDAEQVAADKAQFEEERADPYKKLQFKQSMLDKLPITATNQGGVTPDMLKTLSENMTTTNELLRRLGLLDDTVTGGSGG
jgi:hypothetical protein